MVVGDTTVNGAGTALTESPTEVTPVKLVPVRVTVVPTGPLVGVKPVIVGVHGAAGGVTVKTRVLVAVPAAVVTATVPALADMGTEVVMVVGELTVNTAEVRLNVTAVTPLKLVPVMVTGEPAVPLAGVKAVIVGKGGGGGGGGGGGTGGGGGAGTVPGTVKTVLLSTVPTGVETRTLPVRAPLGTVAVMLVGANTANDAGTSPPKSTPVTPMKLVPAMVTVEPTAPLAGRKNRIVGGGGGPVVMVKTEELMAEKKNVLSTAMGPVVSRGSTVAKMVVGESTSKFARKLPMWTPSAVPKRPGQLPKLVPVMVTAVPTGPLVGVKLVIVGAPPKGGPETSIAALPTTPATDAVTTTGKFWQTGKTPAVVSKVVLVVPAGVVTLGGTASTSGSELVRVMRVGVVGNGPTTPKFTKTRTRSPPATPVIGSATHWSIGRPQLSGGRMWPKVTVTNTGGAGGGGGGAGVPGGLTTRVAATVWLGHTGMEQTVPGGFDVAVMVSG
jgi:hypothetical protein